MFWKVVLLVFTAFSISAYADYIQSRSYQNCASMDTIIYCFGGMIGHTDDTSGNMYELDLRSVGTSIQTTQLPSVWSTTTPSDGKNAGLEARHSSIIQQLADGLRIIISGDGVGENMTLPKLLQNETIMYHTKTNTITTVPAFRNVLDASGVHVPNQRLTYFYGGSLATNLTAPGYPIITKLNTTRPPFSWTEISSASNAPTYNSNYILRGQTATLDHKSLIYFLGGHFTNGNSLVTSTAPSFQTPYIFDTQQAIWVPQVTLGGGTGNIPSNRYGHSATLLPNSNKIFIFGGALVTNNTNDDQNYAFLLDIDSNSYTQVNLSTSPSGLNSRIGHSAVLMNTSLFIMFGKASAELTSDIDVIDLSSADAESINWSSLYPPVTQAQDSTNKKASSGVIAGATVGSVFGVSIIVGALVLFWRKKKNQDKKNNFDDYSNINHGHDTTYETSPRPMKYTVETPDLNTTESMPPLYYSNQPEDINRYNEEHFLTPQEPPNTSIISNIKPDEVENREHYQKPNRYEG